MIFRLFRRLAEKRRAALMAMHPERVVKPRFHPLLPEGYVYVADCDWTSVGEGDDFISIPSPWDRITPRIITGRTLDANGHELPDRRCRVETDFSSQPGISRTMPVFIERKALEERGFFIQEAA
jgi:hypothetical protein